MASLDTSLQRVEVTTATTGVRLDPDGYGVLNDEWDYDVVTVRLAILSCCLQHIGEGVTYGYEAALEDLPAGAYHLRVVHSYVKQYDTPYDSSRVHQATVLDTLLHVH